MDIFKILERNSLVLRNNSDEITLKIFEEQLSKELFGHLNNVAVKMFYCKLDGKVDKIQDVREKLEREEQKAGLVIGKFCKCVVVVLNYEEFHFSFYDLLLKIVEEERYRFLFSVRYNTKIPDTILSRSYKLEHMYQKEELEKELELSISIVDFLLSSYVNLNKERIQKFRDIDRELDSRNKIEIFSKIDEKDDLIYLVLKLLSSKENLRLDSLKEVMKNNHIFNTNFKTAVLLVLDQI